MSDPVKSVEMEDVLSSIRRLVTEEHRGELRKTPQEGGAPVGRLVLTPALRVAQENDVADAGADTAQQRDTAPWSEPGATLYHALKETGADGAERNDGDAMTDKVEEDQNRPVTQPEHPSSAPTGTRADTLSAKIAALESAIAQTQDQWEPDGAVGDDYAGTHVETLEWQDHEDTPDAAPSVSDHDQADPEDVDPDEDEALDFLVADETVMDEEALRELVAEIVREELQGALGERITRNVRKLVRREIHRALTAQDFE